MDIKIKKAILKSVFSAYKRKNINSVILHGSRARGDFKNNSDYDIEVYIKGVKLKFNIPSPSLINKNIFIHCTDQEQFEELKKIGHSFLYCSFRDGIPLYGNKWFKNNRNEITKLRPSKEIIAFYLEASLEKTIALLKRKTPYLNYEDGKMAANQLGFAIIMDSGRYPISPHTLKKELIELSKEYRKLSKAIDYTQRIYYENKKPKEKVYQRKIKVIRDFSLDYIKNNFPNNLEKIKEYEKFIGNLNI